MAKKKKIFLDGSALAAELNSGIKHYAAGLYKALDDYLTQTNEYEVYLIMPFRRLDKLSDYDFQNLKVKKIFLPMRIWRSLVVRELLPPMDIFYGKGVYVFPDYNTWRLLRSESVTTVHDLSFEKVPQFVDDKNAEFLRNTVRRSLLRSKAILTVTETMRQEIVEFYKYPAQNIFVTTNAADRAHFYKRSKTEIAKLKRKFGIFGDYLLSVGNIEPRKNHIAMVRAFSMLPEDLRDKYTLVFVGAGGWKLEEIQAEASKALKNNIKIKIYQGMVEDVDIPAFYTGAAATLFTSYYEGFGMSIVESMACGTSVVCSNTSVMPEVAGDAGYMVKPDDIKAIAGQIEKILRQSPEEQKNAEKKNYQNAQSFTWENSLAGLLDSINHVGVKK